MKKIFLIGLIGLQVFLLLFIACEKPKVYPIIPEIKFKSFSIQDSIDIEEPGNSKKMIKLTLNAIDGDGDIGIFNYNGLDSIYPGFEDLGKKDLFTTLYQKIDGKFVEVPLAFPNNFSIPYIEQPQGQDKSIIADIEVSMEIYFAYYKYDTIKYSFYMYDRQKHMSNIAETPEIPADTLGTISAP
jgi:hypothetical protein